MQTTQMPCPENKKPLDHDDDDDDNDIRNRVPRRHDHLLKAFSTDQKFLCQPAIPIQDTNAPS